MAQRVGGCLFVLVLLLIRFGVGRYFNSSPMPLQSEDYRTARQHFQTHLLKHMPAPQNGEDMRPPPGAKQVEYSPALHLQAWISQDAGGPGKKPAVLFLHGGFAIGADDWEMLQPYHDAGYVVMEPALRGENGQQGDYSMFYDEVTDVLAAADYLAQLPGVDAGHIYVAGHSVGGTLTLLSSLTSTRFRAATSFSGAPDAAGWVQGQSELAPFDTSNKEELQMRSAVAYAGSFKCPTRIYCGDKEAFFVRSSRETSERAQKKGLDVEAIIVPGDHFTAVPEEIRQSIRFFQAH